MAARLFSFCFLCLLLSLTPESSSLPFSEVRSYDLPADQAADFFRLLLLSRYGLDTQDYNSEEGSQEENFEFAYDGSNPNHPFRQAVEQYVQERKGMTTVNEANADVKVANPLSTTTPAAPDVLASIPPVTPDKGQKEYAMLRPPVDNHQKIEHWMQSMASGMMGPDQIVISKRKAVP